MVTLVHDTERNQDPLFPIVLVQFPIPVPIPFLCSVRARLHPAFAWDHSKIKMYVFCPILLHQGVRVNASVKFICHLQALYGVFIKSTCAFLCFFSIIGAFLWQKYSESAFLCFFGAKMCFFLLSTLFFSGKHHYSEGFEHKEVNFFQSLFSVLIFREKNFWPRFAWHKVYSYIWLLSICIFGYDENIQT